MDEAKGTHLMGDQDMSMSDAAGVEDIVGQLPIEDLARQFGADPADIQQAVSAAVPALLGGLHANAADPGAASSLMSALADHAGAFPGGLTGLDQIDVADGERIVGHIYGDNTSAVMNQLGGLGGSSGSLARKLLPMLAPLVMAWLAKKMQGQGGGFPGSGGRSGPSFDPRSQSGSSGSSGSSGGSLFPKDGGSASSEPLDVPTSAGHGGGLQDILGQVLGGALGGAGGGSSRGGALPGGLGDILGGLLGGGRR